MATNDDGRPRDGTASQQVGETTPSVPLAVHQQAEWEAEHQYASGWAAGYAAGWQAVADEVARATGVKPYSARSVIRWLCQSIDLDAREPYSSATNGTGLTVAERDVLGRWAA